MMTGLDGFFIEARVHNHNILHRISYTYTHCIHHTHILCTLYDYEYLRGVVAGMN